MKNFLKFSNQSTEKAFIKNYNDQVVGEIRLGFLLAILLLIVFGIEDYFLMPLSYKKIWVIRFGIVIPTLLLTLSLTYIKSISRYLQVIMSAGSVMMGLGLIAMMAIADGNDPGLKLYYAGLMLVILGICTLFRLRFFYALFSSIVIVASYEYISVFIHRSLGGGLKNMDYLIFINNNSFFISATVVSLIAAYYSEYSARLQFAQQEDIKTKHEDINNLLSNMKYELELARQVQLQLLPETHPYIPGVRISSLYKPMEEVGGDFYDFISFQEKNLIGFFISDVSGHGMPAALITSMLKTLNRTAGTLRLSTPKLLNYINVHLTDQIGGNFLTAVYAIYDSESMILKFSRAGHPYPVLISNGEIKKLVSGGGVIGFDPLMEFEAGSVQLERGDKIILYTDGLTEEADDSKQAFEEIFFNKLLPSLSRMPIEDIISVSYRKLIAFKGRDSFEDDICILGFEVC